MGPTKHSGPEVLIGGLYVLSGPKSASRLFATELVVPQRFISGNLKRALMFRAQFASPSFLALAAGRRAAHWNAVFVFPGLALRTCAGHEPTNQPTNFPGTSERRLLVSSPGMRRIPFPRVGYPKEKRVLKWQRRRKSPPPPPPNGSEGKWGMLNNILGACCVKSCSFSVIPLEIRKSIKPAA